MGTDNEIPERRTLTTEEQVELLWTALQTTQELLLSVSKELQEHKASHHEAAP